MYLRLWWKDARQFWPIWALLVLVAGAMQLLVHHYGDPELHATMLGPLAIGWAGLYAFAVGAAAFAGEREAGTLRLLDLLPAPRRAVWAGKVSFAVVTTGALALLLLAMACLEGPPRFGGAWGTRDETAFLGLVVTLGQGLAWGLFCSSILPSALAAAVAAIGLTVLTRLVRLDEWLGDPGIQPAWEAGVALAALSGSRIAFTWGRRRRRLPFALRLRSPIEIAWAGPPRAAAAVAEPRPPAKADPLPEVIAPSRVATARPGRTIATSLWPVDRPRPRSRLVEFRSLLWQAIREGRGIGLLLLAVGLMLPAQALLEGHEPGFYLRTPLPFLWNHLVVLGAGVSAFGLENRQRTHRLLAHHGARPGTVWLAKLGAWSLALMLIGAPLTYAVVTEPHNPQSVEAWTTLARSLPLSFAVAALCGMAIPRMITAMSVAMVVSLAGGMGQYALVRVGMLPDWGVLVLPVALLAVTWIWSGDWLLERPAPGRYVRLGLTLSGALATVFSGYVGWRAWSVPDAGPIAMPAAWVSAVSLPEDQDAAPLYRQAGAALERARASGDEMLEFPPEASSVILFEREQIVDLDRHPEVFDLIRRAASRPECRLIPPGRASIWGLFDLPPMTRLSDAVVAHVMRDIRREDLEAAWDDILVLFRMARHASEGAMTRPGLTALGIEQQALALARRWAEAPGQSPDRLRGAIAAYRALPRMAPAADIIRAEGLAIERAIDLPAGELKERLFDLITEGRPERSIGPLAWLWLDAITTPWERERARRLNRGAIAEASAMAALEPGRRARVPAGALPTEALVARERAGMLPLLQPNIGPLMGLEDRNEVGRRALVQVLALRAWQLRHGGRSPDRLEDLVPEDLPSLPLDPYSGRPFGYGEQSATADLPAGMSATVGPAPPLPPPIRTIFSVGPDGRPQPGLGGSDNIVFPVPPPKAEGTPR